MSSTTAQDGHAVMLTIREAADASSTCILAHGITSDRTEGGVFDRQAVRLAESGVRTVQLDFRGHGESQLASTEITPTGQALDLQAVIESTPADKPIYLLAASFGAVIAALLPATTKNRVSKLALWNPVTDVQTMFFEPRLPWAVRNFGANKIDRSRATGQPLVVEGAFGAFALGPAFFGELRELGAADRLAEYRAPTLVVHGDADTFASFEDAQAYAQRVPGGRFVPIAGAEHGFHESLEEKQVLELTTDFLLRQ